MFQCLELSHLHASSLFAVVLVSPCPLPSVLVLQCRVTVRLFARRRFEVHNITSTQWLVGLICRCFASFATSPSSVMHSPALPSCAVRLAGQGRNKGRTRVILKAEIIAMTSTVQVSLFRSARQAPVSPVRRGTMSGATSSAVSLCQPSLFTSFRLDYSDGKG